MNPSNISKDRSPAAPTVHDTSFRETFLMETKNFRDLVGHQKAKDLLLEKVIKPLRHSEEINGVSSAEPRFFLLEGPSGCGKTALAQAVAGEVNGDLYRVGLATMIPTPFCNDRLAQFASEVRQHHAETKRPIVLSVDDTDEDMGCSGAFERTLTACMAAIESGALGASAPVLLVVQTSDARLIPAQMRSKFDGHQAQVGLPARDELKEIFGRLLERAPVDDSVSTEKLARLAEGLSFREVLCSCQSAMGKTIKEAFASGREFQMTQSALELAIKRYRP